MTVFLGLLLSQVLLGQESVSTFRPDSENRLRVGETLSGLLTAGGPHLPGRGLARCFDFHVESAGPVTISLESYDFDAFLRVETEAGVTTAEDDNGGIETNARVVLSTSSGVKYKVFIVAATGGEGSFTLSVAAGEVAIPSRAGRLEAAIAYRATAAERALARGDKKAALRHRLEEGGHRYSRSQFVEARAAFESTLSLAREVDDRQGEAQALGGLGLVYRSRGDYVRARECHEQSLALARELGDRVAEAAALGSLGAVYASRGEKAKARDYFLEHLALAREMGDRAGEAVALGNLGGVFQDLGEYAKAQEHHERALALFRELGHRRGEASTLGNLGIVKRFLGDYAGAREHFARHLDLAREVGDRGGEARALGELGSAHYLLGDYSKARECYERCLAITQEIGDRAGEARAFGDLGNLHYALEDFRSAVESYEQELALARELGERAGEAGALVNLGVVRSSLGDFAKARGYMESALAYAREQGNRALEATGLGNLGTVYYRIGDLDRARECYERHLILAQELGDLAGEAWVLANLGGLYAALKDPAQARECLERSLALARRQGHHLLEAWALGDLAQLSLALDDDGRAREMAEASLTLYERLGAERESLYPLSVLALARLAERNSQEARRTLEQAENVLARLSGSRLEIREVSHLRSRFSVLGGVAQDLTALRMAEAGQDAAARSSIAAEGFAAAGRWKGRALLEGIAEHRAGGRSAEALGLRREKKETLARRNRVLERVSAAIGFGRAPDEIEALREEARSLLARAEDLDLRLGEVSPRDAELDAPRGADPESVRRVLGPGTALVEYAEGEKRLYAYVVTEKDLVFLDLGENDAIRRAANAFLSCVAKEDSLCSLQETAERGRSLFESLLAPAVREAGLGLERIVIVPTAPLASLPFEALVTGVREGTLPRSAYDLEFVLDRYEVCYVPSSPVLIELVSLDPRRTEGKALVLADPLYPTEQIEATTASRPPSSVLLASASWRAAPDPNTLWRLGETRNEALALARLFEDVDDAESAAALTRLADQRSGSISFRGLDLHLGAEASRRRLQGDLKSYSILHLAAHGYVDREFPQRSGIALAFGEGENGFFTIADVLELDLDANLVVLSACKTAQGEVRAGEGVESMARAFLYAGARGVVASLWHVEDQAAQETMERFYREAVERGLGASQALRKAKLAARRSNSLRETASGLRRPDSGRPFFWAPFIYIGLPDG